MYPYNRLTYAAYTNWLMDEVENFKKSIKICFFF
jgi:hypothetical protein